MCSTLAYNTNNNNNFNKKNNNNNNNNNMSNLKSSNNFNFYRSKVSPSRRLKNILKPLLGRILKSKSKKPKRSSYIASEEKEIEFEWLHNEMENRANEHLEQELLQELQHGAAFVIYDELGKHQKIEEIDKDDLYVPVHFARTNAGTFFWTSMQRKTIEPYHIEWNFLDRWAQA